MTPTTYMRHLHLTDNIDITAEMALIVAKTSTLSARMRLAVVRAYLKRAAELTETKEEGDK